MFVIRIRITLFVWNEGGWIVDEVMDASIVGNGGGNDMGMGVNGDHDGTVDDLSLIHI